MGKCHTRVVEHVFLFCWTTPLVGQSIGHHSLSAAAEKKRKSWLYWPFTRLGLCYRTTFIYQVARRRKRENVFFFLFFQQPAPTSQYYLSTRPAFFSPYTSLTCCCLILNTISRVCVKFFTWVWKENTENRLPLSMHIEWFQSKWNQIRIFFEIIIYPTLLPKSFCEELQWQSLLELQYNE